MTVHRPCGARSRWPDSVQAAPPVRATPVGSDESLVFLPADCDLNAYLGLCDVLITDYSSVAADFLLLHRPIIVFAA